MMLKMRGNWGLAVMAAAVVLLEADEAHALPFTDLPAGASITAGDKTFSDSQLNFVFDEFYLKELEVTPLADRPNDLGLRFTAPPSFLFGAPREDSELAFEYTVRAPAPLIQSLYTELIDFALAVGTFDRSTYGPASGTMSITTEVTTLEGEPRGQARARADIVDDAQVIDPLATAAFAPEASIRVATSINVGNFSPLAGVDDEPFGYITAFDQRISQTTVSEPSSLLLFGIGLGVLGLLFIGAAAQRLSTAFEQGLSLSE